MCRECPPAPSCPAPQPCPEVKCPECKPCPAAPKCPPPAPCPTTEKCRKCSDVKYIKVPTLITKTVVVDSNGNVVSQKVSSGDTTSSGSGSGLFSMSNMIGNLMPSSSSSTTTTTTPSTSTSSTIANKNEMPSTTFPSAGTNEYCPSAELNSDFKQYGIYGP